MVTYVVVGNRPHPPTDDDDVDDQNVADARCEAGTREK